MREEERAQKKSNGHSAKRPLRRRKLKRHLLQHVKLCKRPPESIWKPSKLKFKCLSIKWPTLRPSRIVPSMAQLTKMGHVYVISNVGSFRKNVFKIGMTRRLEPDDRIQELSGAAVPFSFDIHAMIFSQDAPALETAFHTKFADRRINLVNPRKEYFRVSLEEVSEFATDRGLKVEFPKCLSSSSFVKARLCD